MNRVWAWVCAAIVLVLPLRSAEAAGQPTGIGGLPIVTIYSPGASVDASTQIQAALNACAVGGAVQCNVRLSKRASWKIAHPVGIACGQSLYGGGAAINNAVVLNAQDAPFIAGGGGTCAAAAQQGVLLTLAAAGVVGGNTITITTNPGLAAGDRLAISAGSFAAQSLVMSAIVGTSNPYTIYLGEGGRLSYAYPTGGGTTAYANNPPQDEVFDGEGATITASVLSARCGEFSGCQRCSVKNLTCRGPHQWGVALDEGSANSSIENFTFVGDELIVVGAANNGSGLCRLTMASSIPSYYVTGTVMSVRGIAGATACNGDLAIVRVDATHLDLTATTWGSAYTGGGRVTYSGIGAACESCTNSRLQRITVSGIGSSSAAGTGLYVYSAQGVVVDEATVSGCAGGYGIAIDTQAGGATGTTNLVVQNSRFAGCASGAIIADGAAGVTIAHTRVEQPTSYGVLAITQTSGAPAAVTVDDVTVTSPGLYGFDLVNGDDFALTNTRVSGAGVAALNSAATNVRVMGGRWDGNAAVGVFATDLVVSDLVAVNNLQGFSTAGNPNADFANVKQIVNTGSTTVDGWYQTGSGTWNLTNCVFDVRGSTGVKIGVITSAGRVNLQSFRALGDTGSNSYWGFINGGGAIYYDTTTLVDTTHNGASGTVTATGALNELH